MQHLKSDYEAIKGAIKTNPLDSEDDIRGLHLEVVEFVMAFSQELEKQKKALASAADVLTEHGEEIDDLGEAIDEYLERLSKNYLDFHLGGRIAAQLQKGMEITASLVKVLEEEFGINDIRKQQIHAVVEPFLEENIALLAELDDITDKEEEDDDGTSDDDGDGDPDSGHDGDGGDEDGGEEGEGAAEEGA